MNQSKLLFALIGAFLLGISISLKCRDSADVEKNGEESLVGLYEGFESVLNSKDVKFYFKPSSKDTSESHNKQMTEEETPAAEDPSTIVEVKYSIP